MDVRKKKDIIIINALAKSPTQSAVVHRGYLWDRRPVESNYLHLRQSSGKKIYAGNKHRMKGFTFAIFFAFGSMFFFRVKGNFVLRGNNSRCHWTRRQIIASRLCLTGSESKTFVGGLLCGNTYLFENLIANWFWYRSVQRTTFIKNDMPIKVK